MERANQKRGKAREIRSGGRYRQGKVDDEGLVQTLVIYANRGEFRIRESGRGQGEMTKLAGPQRM